MSQDARRQGSNVNLERDLLIHLIAESLATELSLVRTAEPPSIPPRAVSVQALAVLVERERLTGFVRHHSEFFSLPPKLIGEIRKEGSPLSELDLEIATLSLHAWTLRISRLLSEESIDHLVFKGWPLAMMSAAEASIRGAGDIDVLIRPEDVPLVDRLLTRSGFHPVYALGPRSRLGWSFVCFRNREMPYRSDWVEVDVHWRVATEPEMLPDARSLLRRAVTVGLSGQEIRTLHPSDALAASAYHFYLDYCHSLRRLIDFIRLCARADGGVLIDLPLAARQVIADLVRFCETLFGLRLPELGGLPDPSARNVVAMVDMFQRSYSPGERSSIPNRGGGGPLRRNFRHLSRYSSRRALIIRLIARGLVWFPKTADHPRRIGMVQAFLWQLGRLLRGRTNSDI